MNTLFTVHLRGDLVAFTLTVLNEQHKGLMPSVIRTPEVTLDRKGKRALNGTLTTHFRETSLRSPSSFMEIVNTKAIIIPGRLEIAH